MSHSSTIPSTCANCGDALQGRFCQSCGQRAIVPVMSLHDFFHEAVYELAHLDGKVAQTLIQLVTSPGSLTRDFLAGRRVRYVPPLRVYLTCSILFFALVALAPRTTQSVITVRHTGPDPMTVSADVIREKIAASFVHDMPRLMFVLMPFFAFLTWMFYRRAQPYYVAHLYHALHLHAFVFLLMSVWIVLSATGPAGNIVARALMLTAIPYYYVSLWRVLGGSKLMTVVKRSAIGIIYLVSLGAATAAVIRLVLTNPTH